MSSDMYDIYCIYRSCDIILYVHFFITVTMFCYHTLNTINYSVMHALDRCTCVLIHVRIMLNCTSVYFVIYTEHLKLFNLINWCTCMTWELMDNDHYMHVQVQV